MQNLHQRCCVNKLLINPTLANIIVISPKQTKEFILYSYLTSNGPPVNTVNSFKYLGVVIDNKLDFKQHIKMEEKKEACSVGILFFVQWYNNLESHLSHYIYIFKRLKSLLYRAIRAVAKCYYRDEVKTCIHLTIFQVDDLLSEIAKFAHCFVTNVLIGNYFCKTVEHSGTRQPVRPT